MGWSRADSLATGALAIAIVALVIAAVFPGPRGEPGANGGPGLPGANGPAGPPGAPGPLSDYAYVIGSVVIESCKFSVPETRVIIRYTNIGAKNATNVNATYVVHRFSDTITDAWTQIVSLGTVPGIGYSRTLLERGAVAPFACGANGQDAEVVFTYNSGP